MPGYIDEGISGTSTRKRDDFNRMIRDAKAGLFDFIITKEISRFSRSTLDSIKYTQELLENGVGVFFQNDNINTLDADSEFRLVIMAGVAQCSDLLLYLGIYNRKLVKESGKMDGRWGIEYKRR